MVFDARLPVPAREPATPAEVVAGDLVLTAAAVPDPVAAVVHRDAGVIQTPELLRPAAETSGTIIRNFFCTHTACSNFFIQTGPVCT